METTKDQYDKQGRENIPVTSVSSLFRLPQIYSILKEISVSAAFVLVLVITLLWFSINLIVNQKSVPLLIEISSLYQADGKRQDAARVLDEAADIGTKDPVLLGRIGETYRLLQQYDKAIYTLKKAKKIDPDNLGYALSYARSLGSSGRCQQAIPEYKKLIVKDAENATYSLGLVGCYRVLKEYDLAFAELDRLSGFDPLNIQVYLVRGAILRSQQNWTDAVDQYFKALEINPLSYPIRSTIGEIYLKQRNYASARMQFQEASKLEPERVEPMYWIAESYLGQGNFYQAIQYYNKALQIESQHTPSILGLAKSYSALGDCQSASPYFDQLLANDPDNEDAIRGNENCRSTQD